MAFQDRPYYRDSTPSRFGPLVWLLNGSVPLFTVFGLRVRAHASLLVTVALVLLLANTRFYWVPGTQNALTMVVILFASVLLHEFGHCFAARGVGGEADEILMSPLGGLAFARPPRRPWPSFVTTAAGPATTAAICLLSWAVLLAVGHAGRMRPWSPSGHAPLAWPLAWVAYYAGWVFVVNLGLLLFNLLLVFYPFDGGRMLQELLWVKLGYYRSMRIAVPIGMVGAVGVMMFAIAVRQPLLFLIGAQGLVACVQQRRALIEGGPDGFEDEQGGLYAAAYEPLTPRRRRKGRLATWAGRRAVAKARAATVAAQQEREQVDAILAKVSRGGLASLTRAERRTLRRATAARRRRDVELSR